MITGIRTEQLKPTDSFESILIHSPELTVMIRPFHQSHHRIALITLNGVCRWASLVMREQAPEKVISGRLDELLHDLLAEATTILQEQGIDLIVHKRLFLKRRDPFNPVLELSLYVEDKGVRYVSSPMFSDVTTGTYSAAIQEMAKQKYVKVLPIPTITV